MKYSSEQIMNLSTEKFTAMKKKRVEIKLKDGRIYDGIIENLREATFSHPPQLIDAIIVNGKAIVLPQIESLELKEN